MKTQVFISYKTGDKEGLTSTAHAVRRYLEGEGYEVWMDKSELVAGETWNSQIYEAISKSDILLLLLAEPAAQSIYVRREVDYARGAQVFILPVVVRDGFDFSASLKEFDLTNVQIEKLIQGADEEYNKLKAAIENNKAKTRDRQVKWLEQLLAGNKNPVFKESYKPPTRNIAAYGLPEHDCKIFLAGGDLAQMRGIDVLVNPENGLMQMARIFESATVSSQLRLNGSYRRRNGQIVEDTVQLELYGQIRSDDYNIPINMGWVVPTHAGHSESRLALNKARYIFHVVTVSVEYAAGDRSVIPLPDGRINEAVCNCLDKIAEVDRNQGVISPPNSVLRTKEEAERASYQPIESIIFPLFATGRGGREREIADVARAMITAIRNYFTGSHDDLVLPNLKSIHLCAYSPLDVELIKAEMDNLLEPRKR